MLLKREDLMAAASAGILQYKQVDTMLVFLRQREVVHQREEAKPVEQQRSRSRQVLMTVLAILAIVAAGMLAAMNLGYLPRSVQLSTFGGLNAGNLQWFIGSYAVFTLLATTWAERSRLSSATRVLITTLIALVPLAMIASQQYRLL